MAARLGEQKHYLIVDPALETLATLEQLRKPLLNLSISVLARPLARLLGSWVRGAQSQQLPRRGRPRSWAELHARFAVSRGRITA